MTTENNPGVRPWVRYLLIGSLSVNLLIVGLAAGSAYRFREARDVRPPPSVGAMLFRELSREDRQALRVNAQERGSGYRKARYAEGVAVTEALRAQPFDKAALEAVLNVQAQNREVFQRRIQAAWIDRIDGMSDAGRADYADRLEQRMKKDHKRRK